MFGNERVHHEARLFRGYPTIAPLAGNGANQLFVGGEFPQYVIGGAVETVRQYRFQPSGNQWRSQRGREFGQGIPLHAIGHFAEQSQVTVDGLFFVREGRQ